MDKARALIASLSTEENIQFKDFLQRKRKRDDRLDIRLFDILRSSDDHSAEKVALDLYGSSSKKSRNSYSALKKRLVKNLELFIFTQRTQTDNTLLSQAFMYISLCKQLFSKRQNELAMYYLDQASQIADKNGNVELKTLVQSIHIENNTEPDVNSLQKIINEKKNSLELVKTQAEKVMAWSILKKQLENFAFSGQTFPMEHLNLLLNDSQVKESIQTEPKMLFGLAQLIRKASFTAKDFDHFAEFLSERIKEMEEIGVFTDDNLFHRLHLLYMEAHILYRKRKFGEALSRLENLKSELNRYSKRYQPLFDKKIEMLKSLIYVYTGKLSEALSTTKALSRKRNSDEIKAGLSVYNAFFQFCRENYREANKICLRFPVSEKWALSHIGAEFLLKFKMIHIITLLELGHTDIAIGKLEYALRDLEIEKLNPFFVEAKAFLKHTNKWLNDKSYFAETNDDLIQYLSGETGWKNDIQIIAYNAWIKAKVLSRNYYDVLVESMAQA